MEEKKNRREGKYLFFSKKEKNGKGKGGTCLEKKNIFFVWIRRKTEKERGNYFEKENVFFLRRRKSRKMI